MHLMAYTDCDSKGKQNKGRTADETIVFHQLSKQVLSGIVEIQLSHLRTRLADRGISLTISDAAMSMICDEGFDPQFGARPVKRVIQHRLENPIANGILSGEYDAGDTISVGCSASELTFTNAHEPQTT